MSYFGASSNSRLAARIIPPPPSRYTFSRKFQVVFLSGFTGVLSTWKAVKISFDQKLPPLGHSVIKTLDRFCFLGAVRRREPKFSLSENLAAFGKSYPGKLTKRRREGLGGERPKLQRIGKIYFFFGLK